MSKIIADEELNDWARKQPPGNSSVYVNWDAIRQLPEEYEAVMTSVRYDPAKPEESFANVGSRNSPSWYPNTELMYEIAEARGVLGLNAVISKAIIEDVDYSRLTHPGDLNAAPEFRQTKVGHRVVKASEVLMEDGSKRRSSDRESVFNAWDRANELWSSEEAKTEGYTNLVDGPYTMYDKKKNGLHYIDGKYAKEPKYNTPFKRKAHLDELMKHAAANADTKAQCKTIRELAGLPTGFSSAQLSTGVMVFVRIQRSEVAIKADAAARRVALSRGLGDGGQQATAALFGGDPVVALPEPEAEAIEPSDDDILVDFDASPPQAETQKPEHERARDALAQYVAEGFVNDKPADLDLANQMIEWINKWGQQCTTDPPSWQKVLTHIRKIEESVDDGRYVDHGLALS